MASINSQNAGGATPHQIISMLTEWYNVKQQLDTLKKQESTLRKQVFEAAFEDPKEGTNTLKLPDGWALKAQHVVNRSVDAASFKSLTLKLEEMGVDTEKLVKFKPELSKSAYNKLTDEQLLLMNECVIARPGTPQLSITQPKRG